MAEEHKHTKDCGCDHHYQPSDEKLDMNELDAGGKALAVTVKVFFMLLKSLMVIMVVVYFLSGIFKVEPGWQGLVLRFGKIVGQGEERVKNPGPHWRWPRPIDEVLKLPVRQQQTLAIDKEFWYFGDERARFDKVLKPGRDGYCLTRNDSIGEGDGDDYNIVHSKWVIKYHIGDIEMFYKNIYMLGFKPGQDFYDVKSQTVEPYIHAFACDAVINTMAKYSIDQSLTESKTIIASDVKDILEIKLGEVDSGIIVDSVLLDDITWPRQVEDAFLASTKAVQERDKEIIIATKYKEKILTEAGGSFAEEIIASLDDEKLSDDEKEKLWDKIAGTARQQLTGAEVYRTRVVETARANVNYLEKLLPEYRKRPGIVVDRIYQDAMEEVLSGVDDKMFIHPDSGGGREIRLLISRDPKKEVKK